MLTPSQIETAENRLRIIKESMDVMFEIESYAEWLDLFVLAQTMLFDLYDLTADEKYCSEMNGLMDNFSPIVRKKCAESDIETREMWQAIHLKTLNIMERMKGE